MEKILVSLFIGVRKENTAFVNEINHEKTNYSACEQIDWFYKSNAHSYIDSMNSDTSSAFVIDNKAVDILTENMNSDYQNALKKLHWLKRL